MPSRPRCSYEVVERGAAAGIVITASHNPWTDNGFKVKAATGAAAGPEILAVIEAVIAGERRPRHPAPAVRRRRGGRPGRALRPVRGLRAVRPAARSTSTRCGPPTCGSSSTRCGAREPGWISRLLAGGRIRVTEIHPERNPYFGGVNPEPIRPQRRRGAAPSSPAGGFDLGLLLDGDADRAGAVDERGVFIHQLQVYGLLMYYLAEHRGLRQPVVKSVNETSMAERLGAHYGIDVHETPVGFKYVGPEDDRDRRDDRRRGVGRLRLRHAPARARRHLRRPAPARPLPAREGGRALAGLDGDRPPPRDRRPVATTSASTSTSIGRPTRP